jgi:hypothetical protein
MTKEDICNLSEDEINLLVQEHIFNMIIIELHLDWYPVPVKCFYYKDSPYVQYSWDKKACNAMIFRNGIDDSDGIAKSIPFYSNEIEAAWMIIEKLRDQFCFNVRTIHDKTENKFVCEIWGLHSNQYRGQGIKVYSETASEAICKAALILKLVNE